MGDLSKLVHTDDVAVDAFAAAMKAKLAKARAKGRGGWDDKAQCSQQYLSDLLRGHVEKGDPVVVANFCMMLQQRGEAITAAPAQGQQAGQEPFGYLADDGGSMVAFFRAEDKDQFDAFCAEAEPLNKVVLYTAPQPAPAQDVEGWIPVSERLPEVGERVLGSTDPVEEVTYWAHKPGVHDGEAGWCDTHENLVEVTHWMPLPAAPAHDKQSGEVKP